MANHQLTSFATHSGWISLDPVTPSGRFLFNENDCISPNRPTSVRFYNLFTGDLAVHLTPTISHVSATSFSSDNKLIAISDRRNVSIVDTETGFLLYRYFDNDITSFLGNFIPRFSDDNKTLWIVQSFGNIVYKCDTMPAYKALEKKEYFHDIIYQTMLGQAEKSDYYSRHCSTIDEHIFAETYLAARSLEPSLDDKFLLIDSRQKFYKYNTTTHEKSEIDCLSPIVSTTKRLYNDDIIIPTTNCIQYYNRPLQIKPKHRIISFSLSYDRVHFVYMTSEYKIYIWDAREWEKVSSFRLPFGFHPTNKVAMCLSPDNTLIAVSGSSDTHNALVAFFDTQSGEHLRTLDAAASVITQRLSISDMKFSPDGKWITFDTGESLFMQHIWTSPTSNQLLSTLLGMKSKDSLLSKIPADAWANHILPRIMKRTSTQAIRIVPLKIIQWTDMNISHPIITPHAKKRKNIIREQIDNFDQETLKKRQNAAFTSTS